MNFCWVTLRVTNMAKSLEFYHEIMGLPINSSHSGNGIEVVMLGHEGMPKIELLYMDDQTKKMESDISIGISVISLDETIEYLSKNYIKILRGPISPNPHTRFAFVHDPDGYEVQLVEGV